MKECKTLPLGPVRTTSSWHAGERLGFSTFGAFVWGRGMPPTWVFLYSRVLEKSSAYLVACLERVKELTGAKRYKYQQHWADGPKQMKSTVVMGSSFDMMRDEPDLDKVAYDHGCPGHWKGEWDTKFGMQSRRALEWCKGEDIETVEEFTDMMQRWGRQEQAKFPEGNTFIFEHFRPKPKSSYALTKFTTRSVCGVENMYSWTFTRADNVRKPDGTLRRKNLLGRNPLEVTGIRMKCHVLTNCPADDAHTGFPDIDPDGPSASPDPEAEQLMGGAAELALDVQFDNGWKVSYIKKPGGKVERRRNTLNLFNESVCGITSRLPESHRHRSMEESKAAALLSAKRRKVRAAATKAFDGHA